MGNFKLFNHITYLYEFLIEKYNLFEIIKIKKKRFQEKNRGENKRHWNLGFFFLGNFNGRLVVSINPTGHESRSLRQAAAAGGRKSTEAVPFRDPNVRHREQLGIKTTGEPTSINVLHKTSSL